MHRGKLLILFMFGSAAVVAAYAIWYRHQQSSRVLQQMSPNVAALIAYAPRAELQRLVPAPPKDAAGTEPTPVEIIRLQGQSYWIVEQKDAAGLLDFSTVRGWLLHNDNYDWSQPPEESAGPWQYGILFSNGAEQTRLLFDLKIGQVLVLPGGGVLNAHPMIDGLKSFFAEQFPAAEKKGDAAANKD